jgi:predicted ATPase
MYRRFNTGDSYMITELFLKNFKPFGEQNLAFKNLTVLSGLNSTGKSSVLQSLLLLRQSFQQELLNEVGLALNGDLVSIGTGKDALYESATEDILKLKIYDSNEATAEWCFNYNRNSDVMELDRELSNIDSGIDKSSLFNDNFHYIQAERLGPRRYFEISDFQVRQHRQIGSRGEYTAYFLDIYQDEKILSNLNHLSANSLTLKDQLEAWMSEISPGTRVNITTNSAMDILNLQYSYGLSNDYRSTNVGFGITYILPILVAILSAQPDTLILLENPEAHLHPKGQSKMGRLLALAANCGIQIIVETHSDHLLNGIRVAVCEELTKADDVKLYYFRRHLEDENNIITEVVSPRLSQDGGIDLWPDGFFDQSEHDLMNLL